MPMPAISINGHQWYYYIFFESKGNLVWDYPYENPSLTDTFICQFMLGAYPIGTTFDVNGTWRILYHLDVFIEWGRTHYRKWFEENVLPDLEDRVAQNQSGLANVGSIGVAND